MRNDEGQEDERREMRKDGKRDGRRRLCQNLKARFVPPVRMKLWRVASGLSGIGRGA